MGLEQRRRLTWTGACALLGSLFLACSSEEPAGSETTTPTEGPTETEQEVEIFSWWIAPGEAEALQALVDVSREQNPEYRIFNAAAESGADARSALAARLAANDPPDLFQQNSHELSAFLEANPGSLTPLDDMLADANLDTAILSEVLGDVTIDGSVYAMPVNIHRENTLFYNRQIFADNAIAVPTTIEDFLQACETLRTAGVTPVATAHQGWILRIMFNALAMGSMGGEAFHDFMTGGPRDDAALQGAIQLFGVVLQNYTNTSAADEGFGWTNAAETVLDGQAAMFFHGDWAKGYYVQLGWTPGLDFGVSAAPGAADVFWYGVDTFSLPVGAQHPEGAIAFLQTIGSDEGQISFNRLKGSTPIRLDIPADALDVEGQATLQDLETATYRLPVVNQLAWDDAMLAFAQTGDEQALFQAYVDNPPVP